MSNHNEAITLALSRRIAMVEGRNQQESMTRTAKILRDETKDPESFEALTLFIGMNPKERQVTIEHVEKDILKGVNHD